MLQYFYIISHSDSNGIRFNDKVFLQEKSAVKWGRKQATKFQAYNYWIQRCPITSAGMVENDAYLPPFRTFIDEEFLT